MRLPLLLGILCQGHCYHCQKYYYLSAKCIANIYGFDTPVCAILRTLTKKRPHHCCVSGLLPSYQHCYHAQTLRASLLFDLPIRIFLSIIQNIMHSGQLPLFLIHNYKAQISCFLFFKPSLLESHLYDEVDQSPIRTGAITLQLNNLHLQCQGSPKPPDWHWEQGDGIHHRHIFTQARTLLTNEFEAVFFDSHERR